MTLTGPISFDRNRLLDQQHLVMHDVPWSFYEDLLAQIESRPLRVTFDHGRLEIMGEQKR